jgi:hypothetical protein
VSAVEVEITDEVRNHHTNEDYECLRAWFDPYEDPVDIIYNDMGNVQELNWMPRFSSLEKIIRKLCELDPEFQDRVKRIIRDIERDIPRLEVDN